jgi:hypothetical protein
VLNRGGKLFNQHSPLIIPSAGAKESDLLALLGLLNSSTACFWMKQNFQTKGSSGIGRGVYDERWEFFYEHTGTGVGAFPVLDSRALTLPLARHLDELAQTVVDLSPGELIKLEAPTAHRLTANRAETERIQARMVALQEELDWLCYRLYGLLDAEDPAVGDADAWSPVPGVLLSQRPFEIVLARKVAAGEEQTAWFERHGSTPITEIPPEWPGWYRDLVARRIALIETAPNIGLIERPEYKRRWLREPWDDKVRRALRSWLLDRLESPRYWPDPTATPPELTSCARLADVAARDAEFLGVAAIYAGRGDVPVAKLVAELVASESVPFLPVLRYKPSGLVKRRVWERTWDLQRREDAGEDVGPIPVPPKYGREDFATAEIWALRGKLDVPKERWISYPYLQTESDPSLVVGWAGWDHLQQATALVAYYDARKREGWDARRLAPILAGLDQLLPWIHQWHPEIDPEFGDTAGQSYQAMLEHDAHELGLTLDDIRNWQPPQTTSRRRART